MPQAGRKHNARIIPRRSDSSRTAWHRKSRAGLDAIERDSPLVIPRFIMTLGMFLVRVMPLSLLRLASRLSAKRS